jgi:hypothetical protein
VTTASSDPGREPAAADSPPDRAPRRPEFDITFADDGVHPEAKVIPEGDVRIEVWNRGSAPHDFVLLQLTEDDGDHPSEATASGAPVPAAPDTPEVGAARHLAPGERASIAATLGGGIYVLLDECCRANPTPRLLELTVQPGG